MNIDNKTIALVVTDPQNDFLSEDDAAAAIDPELGDGYQAAVVNFKFIASEALTTREAVESLG